MAEDSEAPALVMPFVLCQSKGGRFEDEAFTAGWALGGLDHELSLAKHNTMTPGDRYLRSEYQPQADLIAMRHGFILTVAEEQNGWARYEFETDYGMRSQGEEE